MFSSGVQNPKHLKVGVEPKMVWMLLECGTAEEAQSLGRAELDELRLVTGDKCDFKFCVWHQRFHTMCAHVEGPLAQRTLPFRFIIGYGFQPTEFWLLKQTLVNFSLSHRCSRFCCQSLSGTGEVCGDKFRLGCWQNATYIPDTSERSTTHGTNCESHQHISPKQNKNKVTMEAVNERTYSRPDYM